MSWYPRLASPLQAAAIAGGSTHWRHSWPPPGTEQIMWAYPQRWPVLHPVDDELVDRDHGYWASIGEIQAYFPEWSDPLISQGASRLGTPVSVIVGTLGSWPVVWEESVGGVMRWIRSVFRGALGGGVEQFQFKLDWGSPGADPSVDEEDAPGVAADFAGYLTTAWSPIAGQYADDIYFYEIGVAQFTQSNAVNKDGTGGDVEQSYPMGWHTMPAGSRPKGTVTSGITLPYEVSPCVTFITDARGPRGRGRCYLPPPSVGTMTTGGVFASTFVPKGGVFIDAIADAVKTAKGWDLIVVSNRAVQLHKVISIEVGKVPDSQRRRRRSQDEARVVAATR